MIRYGRMAGISDVKCYLRHAPSTIPVSCAVQTSYLNCGAVPLFAKKIKVQSVNNKEEGQKTSTKKYAHFSFFLQLNKWTSIVPLLRATKFVVFMLKQTMTLHSFRYLNLRNSEWRPEAETDLDAQHNLKVKLELISQVKKRKSRKLLNKQERWDVPVTKKDEE